MNEYRLSEEEFYKLTDVASYVDAVHTLLCESTLHLRHVEVKALIGIAYDPLSQVVTAVAARGFATSTLE